MYWYMSHIGMIISYFQFCFQVLKVKWISNKIVIIIIFFVVVVLAEKIRQIFLGHNTIIVSISIYLIIIITIIILLIPIILIKVIKASRCIDFVFFMMVLILNCFYKNLGIHLLKQKFTKMSFTLTVPRVWYNTVQYYNINWKTCCLKELLENEGLRKINGIVKFYKHFNAFNYDNCN